MNTNPTDTNTKLAGAKDALKDKLLQAVLQQAIQELGSPQSIADDLIEEASRTPEFEKATQSLAQRLVAEIENKSLSPLSDVSETVETIFSKIKDSSEIIPETVQEIRAKLIEEIFSKSVSSISDSSAVSGEILSTFDKDQKQVVQATAELRAKLLDEITTRAAESVSDFDAVAAELVNRLGSETTVVDPIVGQLRQLFLSRIEDRARATMESADEVARDIADTISDDDMAITKAAQALREQLILRVKDSAIESVSDAPAVVKDIQASFDELPEEVQAASKELHEILLRLITSEGLSSIDNSDRAAAEARRRISDDDPKVTEVVSALASRLLDDVTQSAISELSERVRSVEGIDLEGIDFSALDVTEGAAGKEGPAKVKDVPADVPEDSESASGLPGVGADDLYSDFSDQLWSDDASDVSETTNLESSREETSESFAEETAEETAEDATSSGSWNHERDDAPSLATEISPVSDASTGNSHPFNEAMGQEPESLKTNMQAGPGDASTHDESAALYVYGIISESDAPDSSEMPSSGIDPETGVHLAGINGLKAAVSKVKMEEFSGDGFKSRLQDKAWLKEKVRLHSNVLDKLNKGRTIIPMRFCTVYRSEDEINQVLRTNENYYQTVLQKIHGKQEWSVRIHRNEEKLAEKVEQSDRVVEDSLGAISKGVVTFVREEMDRLNKVGGEHAIELMSQHCTSRSHAALMECASDGITKPTVADANDNASNIVLNAAYLVPLGEEGKLKDEVDRLASEYSELGFRFEINGPWPPYHFVGEPQQSASTVSA